MTGGSKGIGFRIASILAKIGYDIVICSRHLEEAKKAKRKILSMGASCLALKCDVSNYLECRSLLRKVIKQFKKIDLLVNNAGIQGPIGKLWTNNLKLWEKTIAVNLLGTFYMCHLVIPQMLKQKSGKIINLSGGGGAYARPFFSAYGASKTAILRLTETLAEELKGTKICVFAIAPGATWTNMMKETFKNKKLLDKGKLKELLKIKEEGGTKFEEMERLITFLIKRDTKKLSGRLIHVKELSKFKSRLPQIGSTSGLLRRVDYIAN